MKKLYSFVPNRLIFQNSPEGPRVESTDKNKAVPKEKADTPSDAALKKTNETWASNDSEEMGQCTKGSCEVKPSTDYDQAIKENHYNKIEPGDVDKMSKAGSIVVVSAEWCPKCPGILRAVAAQNPGKNLIVVNYDSDDAGLDAKFGNNGAIPKIAIATDKVMTSATTGKQEKVYDDVTKLYTMKNVK